MEDLISLVSNYLSGLDWAYIMTFILLAYMLNSETVKKVLIKIIPLKVQTRFRVLFVGSVWGGILYYIRGYTFVQIEMLVNSFVFALFFHKILIDVILTRLGVNQESEPKPDQRT